jgi:hypothetical protein
MKLHIENLHITFSNPQPPAGLIAAFALAGAMQPDAKDGIPNIGEKWPGTEATYAGISLSSTDDSLIHLILWPDDHKNGMDYEDAVKFADGVNPDLNSHLPTRHQSITLFERIQDNFNKDYYHWTLTKTKSRKAAFLQDFNYGDQSSNNLSAECRVRAVSEISL